MQKKNIFLRIALVLLIATLSTGGVFVGSGTIAKFVAQAPVVASATVAGFNVSIKDSTGHIGDNGVWVDEGIFKRFDKTGAGTATTVDIGNVFLDFGKGRASIYCTDPWGSDECHVAFNGACDHEPGDMKDCKECYADGQLIAPGTMGKMELTFRNDSDVSVIFYLDDAVFKSENDVLDSANMKFFVVTSDDDFDSTDFPDPGDFDVPLSGMVGKSKAAVTIHPGGDEKTIFVWWIWPFEVYDDAVDEDDKPIKVLNKDQDSADTDLGILSAELLERFDEEEIEEDGLLWCTATFTIKAEQVD